MRFFERSLLIIGSSAFGAASGGLGLAYLAALTVFRLRPGEEPGLAWGAYIGVFVCMLLGGTLGAIVGLVGAVGRITQGEAKSWSPITWIGVVLGLAAGLVIRSSVPLDQWGVFGEAVRLWPGTAICVAALGTLGGFAGSVIGALWRDQVANDRSSS